jgi:hypothetical protein
LTLRLNAIDPSGLAAEDAHEMALWLHALGRTIEPEGWVEDDSAPRPQGDNGRAMLASYC